MNDGEFPIIAWATRSVSVALLGLLAMAMPAFAELEEDRLPTVAELHQMNDAGQYRVCLRQIGRVLRLGNPNKGFDRYDLLLLRGDCLLHLDDPATAQTAYVEAEESHVAAQAHEARAMALLISRSVNMTYTPKTANETGDGFNLTSRTNRMKALAALLRDMLTADRPDIDRAIGAENLVPIHDLLPKLVDLYAVEWAATGGDTQVRPILKTVGERARVLIERELELQNERVAAIEKRSNQRLDIPTVAITGANSWWWGGVTRRGLYTEDRRELRDLTDYLERIKETTKLGQRTARLFDGDVKIWDPLITKATKVLQHARDVRDAE